MLLKTEDFHPSAGRILQRIGHEMDALGVFLAAFAGPGILGIFGLGLLLPFGRESVAQSGSDEQRHRNLPRLKSGLDVESCRELRIIAAGISYHRNI